MFNKNFEENVKCIALIKKDQRYQNSYYVNTAKNLFHEELLKPYDTVDGAHVLKGTFEFEIATNSIYIILKGQDNPRLEGSRIPLAEHLFTDFMFNLIKGKTDFKILEKPKILIEGFLIIMPYISSYNFYFFSTLEETAKFLNKMQAEKIVFKDGVETIIPKGKTLNMLKESIEINKED